MIDHALEQAPSLTITEMSDDVLITLMHGGDAQAFHALVTRHQERVRNLIYSVLNDPSLIDDLAQDVFLKAYEALPHFRFEAAFSTWIYRIALNRCRDEIRRKRYRRWISLEPLLERQDRELTRKTTTHMTDTETRDWIDRALARLPEKYRIPVILKDIEGLSYAEIMEVTQTPKEGTVKSRLFRGREILRKWLQPLMEV